MSGELLLAAVSFCLHVTSAKGWWCQASHGSCAGQRHNFQEYLQFNEEAATSLPGEPQVANILVRGLLHIGCLHMEAVCIHTCVQMMFS